MRARCRCGFCRAVTLRGDQDGLTSQADLDKYRNKLPATAAFLTIAGGNHAQFGSYGFQRGDQIASLAAAEQWARTAELLDVWLRGTFTKE